MAKKKQKSKFTIGNILLASSLVFALVAILFFFVGPALSSDGFSYGPVTLSYYTTYANLFNFAFGNDVTVGYDGGTSTASLAGSSIIMMIAFFLLIAGIVFILATLIMKLTAKSKKVTSIVSLLGCALLVAAGVLIFFSLNSLIQAWAGSEVNLDTYKNNLGFKLAYASYLVAIFSIVSGATNLLGAIAE